jgi:hypothetical protein
VQKNYTAAEIERVRDRLVDAGFGSVDSDVDYEGDVYVVGAELTIEGVQRLRGLEDWLIKRRRWFGRMGRLAKFAKEYQWLIGAAGGWVLRPYFDRLSHWLGR